MSKNAIVVFPADGKWSVYVPPKVKPFWFKSRQEAIQFGREKAINKKRDLIVYREDASIRSRDSFKEEPFPPVNQQPA